MAGCKLAGVGMPELLLRRWGRFISLSIDDRRLVEEVVRKRVMRIETGEDLLAEGDPPRGIALFSEGWAYRYRTLEDGRRQILGYLLPGDLGDVNLPTLREMDHSVASLTAVTVALFSIGELAELAARSPRLDLAMRRDMAVQTAIQREWITSLGRRTALERVAHFLCELFLRLRLVGLTDGVACEMPLNQAELADATGLSAVHVNRVLQQLRSRGLVRLHGRQMELPGLPDLQRIALFNPTYLPCDSRDGVSVLSSPLA